MSAKLAPEFFVGGKDDLGDIMETARWRIGQPLEERISPIRTWYPHLDRMTLGFRPGKLYALGGRPGDGKSTFATNIIANILANSHESVLLISTELEPVEVVLQIAEAHAGGIATSPKVGGLTADEIARLRASQRVVEDAIVRSQLSIMHAKKLDVRMIVDAITHHCDVLNDGRGALIIVDQMNRVKREDKKGHGYAIATEDLMNDFEEIASREGVPILMVSQLNRGREGSDKPTNAHFKHSGGIEEYAHCTMLINRGDDWECEIIVAKNRDGRCGAIPFRFYGEQHKFNEVS